MMDFEGGHLQWARQNHIKYAEALQSRNLINKRKAVDPNTASATPTTTKSSTSERGRTTSTQLSSSPVSGSSSISLIPGSRSSIVPLIPVSISIDNNSTLSSNGSLSATDSQSIASLTSLVVTTTDPPLPTLGLPTPLTSSATILPATNGNSLAGNDGGSDLSTGGIIGIVAGVVVILAFVIIAVGWWIRGGLSDRRRRESQAVDMTSSSYPDPYSNARFAAPAPRSVSSRSSHRPLTSAAPPTPTRDRWDYDVDGDDEEDQMTERRGPGVGNAY